MVDAIKTFFLETVGKELCVLFCSVIPIIELRGAIPMGAAFDLPWWETYILAVIGNMLPVPMVLLGVNWLIDVMSRSKIKLLNKFANWLKNKAEKNKDKIQRFAFWGATLFVGIPLPMTGAWTGSLVCATIGQKFWKSLLSVFLGVLMAGVIMTVISYGIKAIV